MNNVFRYLFILLLLMARTVDCAEQEIRNTVLIDIQNGYLKINDHDISMPSSVDSWVDALGQFSRGGQDPLWGMYIWDEYGIRALTDDDNNIYDFTLYFRNIPGSTPMNLEERLPNNKFTGKFVLNGVEINGGTLLEDYNNKVSDYKYRFKEDYIPIVHSISDQRVNDGVYVYGVSVRIDDCFMPYNAEILYSAVPINKDESTISNKQNKSHLLDSLKNDIIDFATRVSRSLGIGSEVQETNEASIPNGAK